MALRLPLLLVLAASALLLSACIRPFQPDIQQGNILNNSDLREIRFGMSKQEVLFILGTPMVIDPFNEQRWDYFYSRRDQQRRETEQRLITVVFEDDKLARLQGDIDLSNVQSLEPSTEDRHHGGSVITEPTQREKGLFNRLGLFKRSDAVERRLKKVERQRQRDEKRAAREAEKVAARNEKQAAAQAKTAAKQAKQTEKEQAKAAKKAQREAEKAENLAVREAKKAEREAALAAKKAEREAEKAKRVADREARKAEREAARAAKKAEREAAKAAKEDAE